MRELWLGGSKYRDGAPITYGGCLELCAAFTEGKTYVKRLRTVSCDVASKCEERIEELVVGFVLGCPALTYLELGTNLGGATRAAVLAAAEKVLALNEAFRRSKMGWVEIKLWRD